MLSVKTPRHLNYSSHSIFHSKLLSQTWEASVLTSWHLIPALRINQDQTVSWVQLKPKDKSAKIFPLVNTDTLTVLEISIPHSPKNTNYQMEALCAIWQHLHNFKNVKNTHRGVLFLLKFYEHITPHIKYSDLPCKDLVAYFIFNWK